jgi:hypothetical protein
VTATVIALGVSGSIGIGAVSERGSTGSASEPVSRLTAVVDNRAPRSETCPDSRRGLAFYRARHAQWLKMRTGNTSQISTGAKPRSPRNCADARYLAGVWRLRARRARDRYQRWFDAHMLRDVPFGPGSRAWHKAVDEVQRVFPGTSSWLLSCSAAEGEHGRWVGYGGQGYSAWLRDSDTVGGNLQYRWSTFKGHYRRALEYVRARGFIVPPHLRDPGDDRAWRSALGQALAGGWARYTGNDDSHWSASWSRGC